MNAGPASYDDYIQFHRDRRVSAPDDIAQLQALAATEGCAQGDLEADAAYYRVHFRATLRSPERLERLVRSLRTNFTPADILRARAIEHRLMEETWSLSVYNLLPALERLRVSTSVIYGDNDLIPNAVREPHRAGDPLS